jgi:hypothetical protein
MIYNPYNQLTLWYTNNYPYPNVGDVSYNNFSASTPPGQVYFGNASQSPSQPNSITLDCYVNEIETGTTSTTASITNYKISAHGYYTQGSNIRYPLPLADSGLSYDISVSAANSADPSYATFFSLGLDSSLPPIFPSCDYSFNVVAQNNVNSSYGNIGTYYYSSTEGLPEPTNNVPSSLFSFTGSPKYTNNNNIYLVSNKSLVTNDVININSVLTHNNFTSSSYITPVQTTSNLGLTDGSTYQNNPYLTISAEVMCNNVVVSDLSQNIHGFDINLSSTNPYAYTYDSSNSGITLNTSVYDYYNLSDNSCNQGFYLMAAPVMDISSSILDATNNLYTATLTTLQIGTNASTNYASYNFYCDDISSVPNIPSLTSFSLSNNNTTSWAE